MPRHWASYLSQAVLSVAVLAGGVLLAALLFMARDQPEKRETIDRGLLVEVQPVHRRDVQVVVRSYGTVRPRVSVQLIPQVSGTVLELHPALAAGGFFQADEVLIRIDDTDYQLAKQEVQAQLIQAKAMEDSAAANIADFEARLEDARIETMRTRRLKAQNSTTQRELDRVELALKRAQAQLQSARALRRESAGARAVAETRLRIAEVNLARSRISVPFDGRVRTERIDVGQYLVAGQTLAEVYSIHDMEIRVPLEDRQLAWFELPHPDNEPGRPSGAAVRVVSDFAGKQRFWQGRVMRLEAEVDPTSRMANVLVACEPSAQDGNPVMLMPGMFVEAQIQGRTLSDILTIPGRALRTGEHVWVAVNDRLHSRKVQVVRKERNVVYIRGLDDGQLVVTSSIDVVTDGMRIRIAQTPGESNPGAAGGPAKRTFPTEAAEQNDTRSVGRTGHLGRN